MTHEAASPKRAPNSPQGIQPPSPTSSAQRFRSGVSHRRGSARRNPDKPRWDSWGFDGLPSKNGGPAPRRASNSPSRGPSPSRAELKQLTASWSPTRQGFRKADLAKADDGFSRSHRHDLGTSTKSRSSQSAPKQGGKSHASRAKHTPKGSAGTAAPMAADGEDSKAKPSMAQSFLQPILHSQQGHAPDGVASEVGCKQSGQKKGGHATRKVKRSSRSAAQHDTAASAEEDDRQASDLPRVIATDGAQSRGSYNSPVNSPQIRRARPHGNHVAAAHDTCFVIMPASEQSRDQTRPSSSASSAQPWPSQHSGQSVTQQPAAAHGYSLCTGLHTSQLGMASLFDRVPTLHYLRYGLVIHIRSIIAQTYAQQHTQCPGPTRGITISKACQGMACAAVWHSGTAATALSTQDPKILE